MTMSADTGNQAIRGVLPVVHMPYLEDLSIDGDTLQKEVDYVFDKGADGLCLALVSDLLRLTAAERLQLPLQLVEYAGGRGPVTIGVGRFGVSLRSIHLTIGVGILLAIRKSILVRILLEGLRGR